MASSTTQELELRLAEVEHQLAHLEVLERGAGDQAPEGVRAERARRRAALAAERSALRAELEGPSAPPEAHPASWPGLWEPLPLYPAAPGPEAEPLPGASPVTPAPAAAGASPAPPGPEELRARRQQLLLELARIYPRGVGPDGEAAATVLRGVLRRGSDDPAVVRVVAAAAEDFLSLSWLDKRLKWYGVTRPRRPGEGPPPAPPELPRRTDPAEVARLDAEAPDAEGLTRLQRLALEASLLALPAGDRMTSLATLARHLAAEGHRASAGELEASLAPFSEGGGARYPLLALRRQAGDVQLQLTELGNDLLRADASGRRLRPVLPLLLLEGHRGPPTAPPHHLGELVSAVLQLLSGAPIEPPLLPDLAEGGQLLLGGLARLDGPAEQELVSLAELTACRPGAGFNVTLVVRPLMAPVPALELDARLAEAIASGALDPCTWRLDAEGTLTVELGHVAFLSRLVRWLREQGLAERRVRLGYRVREEGLVSREELLRNFVRQALNAEGQSQGPARAELVEHLRLAQALVIGAFLHPVVDALIIEADTPAEARWALRHLNDEALWSRAPFTRLAGEAPRLGALREALEAAHPELAGQLRQGLSEAQAEAIRGATQLGARREALLGDLRRSQAAVAALEAIDTRESRVEAVGRRLKALASRHADARRTRVVSLAQVLPGPGFTPKVTIGP